MTETLYLTLKPGKWNRPRIAKVSKKAPNLTPGTVAAIVKIVVTVPDNVTIPRIPVATVEIKPEHIAPATIKAEVS